ncbi:hypothetical protein [Winogradskyella sp. Asnod2-B02-A]|uniref:hypothetical protein n=1 Tax=Winogradskyella sp. Asnod2-B02-A TaxID=3160583 RepID=UPI003868537C
MIRILLYFLLAFMCAPVLGQQTNTNTNNCVEHFTITGQNVPKPNTPINDTLISWDFSDTPNKEHLEAVIEVQPLSSCWKDLEGKIRGEIKIFKISDISRNSIGDQTITYRDINAKCFKWQAVIIDTETNCNTETEWQFISLL